MDILIAGGGIGGLASAAFFGRAGHKVKLIERAHTWRNIGFVIYLWPNGINILAKLGLDGKIRKSGHIIDTDYIYNSQGEELKKLHLKPENMGNENLIGIERAAVHDILRSATHGVDTSFDTTITSISQKGGKVNVTFSDKSEDSFDMVIGADGTHSQVREEVFGFNKVEYYNWAIWLTTVDANVLPDASVIAIFGAKKGLMVYKSPERTCALFALPYKHGTPESYQDRITLLKREFGGFGWKVPEILTHLGEPKLMFHDDLAKIKMNEWYKNRVVLVGDAEHALSPLLGMGCSMALEDAYTLFTEVNKYGQKPSSRDLQTAFNSYALKRQERIDPLKELDSKLWALLNVPTEVLASVRDTTLRLVPETFFTGPTYDLCSKII